MAAATASCAMYSNKYFALCGAGGALACGATHALVTPLDLVKCRLQVDPAKYGSVARGFRVSYREGGLRNLVKGWAPTLLGYSLQGACKFSGYEYFKYRFARAAGEERAYVHRTGLHLAAAAAAELLADVALAPFEAAKVRMQTTPGYTARMRRAVPHMLATEGAAAFYRGLVPLWGRQVPYTMMKFSSFEATLEALYARAVPKPRAACSALEQLAVTFAAGYIAGVLCAVVSHPADTLVSRLNKDPSASVAGVLAEVGAAGIWRGLGARIVMIGSLTGMQWFVYDAFKVYTGMPRPPPPDMPESLRKKLAAQQK